MGSEADILMQRGMVLTLGNEKKEFPPLTIGKARKWREGITPVLSRLLVDKESDITNPEDLKQALFDSPMDMAQIVAGYVGMEMEAFLDTVTEHELVTAFALVMQEAVLPFFQQEGMKIGMKKALNMAKTKEKASPTTSPSTNGA